MSVSLSTLSILTLAVAACAGAMFGRINSGKDWPPYQHRLPKQNLNNYNDNHYRNNRPDNTMKDCTTILMGTTSSEEITLDLVFINVPRSQVQITDDESFILGQEVTVCNKDNTGAPAVLPPSQGLSPITVVSASALKGDSYGPTNLVMRVTRYLTPVTPLIGQDY